MNKTQVSIDEHGVARLIFRNGRGNPLSPDLLDEINHQLDKMSENPPRALIIDTDSASIYSGGFALPIVASWSRSDLRVFFEGFLDILYKIMRISCPTITVIEGHAIAGGFILSLATDMRYIKDAPIKFGLSEVDLGVALPAGAGVLFEYRTNSSSALYHSMTGHLFSVQTAKEIGFATKVCDDPLEEAMLMAQNLAKKPGKGVAGTRIYFNERIIKEMKKADDEFMDDFLDTWFSTEGQNAIQTLAQKLSNK
ncbi:MAG: hypothetical protein CL916_06585 [Deltaproteobacteria bacterium]|nr:hypothetical protein [Deltaproteobacteria bacterium]